LPLDGVSLLPLLKGKPLDRDAIYFHYPNYAWHRSNRLGGAIRSGKWKLIERFDDNSLELYDLEADLSEQSNLADAHGEVAGRLQKKLANWRSQSNAAMPQRADDE
jgi:arylsulfatase A-like enzyme